MTKKGAEPLGRDHVGSSSALRGNTRDLSGVRGMCQFSNFSPPLNYRGRNRKNLNHDANGKADSVASAAALHILKRDPAADRRLFIRRYRPSSALTLRYRRRRRCGLLIGCCEREGREREGPQLTRVAIIHYLNGLIHTPPPPRL